MTNFSRHACEQLDAADSLAPFRDKFVLPESVIYLDGNSLGALPKCTAQRVAQTVQAEWGNGLIRSWNAAGWMDAPQRIGDKIARLVGADAGEVIVADSTSVNLFKVLSAALHLNKNTKTKIVSEQENFPTDLYMAQGLITQLGNSHHLHLTNHELLPDAINDDTALVMLTHINYRTGRMHDMRAITTKAHAHGAMVIWDLAHSAGALPVALNNCAADFAVGCGYKYLNGGPGAPAFVFVAKRHQEKLQQPLTGWMGHAQPFAFDAQFAPAAGIERMLCGSPAMLSMTALECGIDLWLEADLQVVRRKSLALSDLFMALVAERCAGFDLTLVTPRDHTERGSQVSYTHAQGFAIMQALIAEGVIGDFRAPDILRFGFTPLYVRFVDVWDAVDRLCHILHTQAWQNPAFQKRGKVT